MVLQHTILVKTHLQCNPQQLYVSAKCTLQVKTDKWQKGEKGLGCDSKHILTFAKSWLSVGPRPRELLCEYCVDDHDASNRVLGVSCICQYQIVSESYTVTHGSTKILTDTVYGANVG